MARPKSEDKRRAILDAALRVFAQHGTVHAPTSAISKAAGVAEGTLFTYFKTKDELMNELYLDIRRDFNRMMPDASRFSDARARMLHVWGRYLEEGRAHPELLKVLAQLRASGCLFKENETATFAITEMLNLTRESARGRGLDGAPPEYLVLMFRAQAEVTVEFIAAHPESAEVCRELGFKMLWRGLTGE